MRPADARSPAILATCLPWDIEPVLEVWVRAGQSAVVVAAAGRLDANTADGLVRALDSAGTNAPAVLVDLTAVEQAYPSGWDVVDQHVQRLRSRGVPVGVVGVAPA